MNLVVNILFSSGLLVGDPCTGTFSYNPVTGNGIVVTHCQDVQFTGIPGSPIPEGRFFVLINGEPYPGCRVMNIIGHPKKLEVDIECPGIPVQHNGASK